MKKSEIISAHRLPCGPMEVKVDGVCRRRLRDEYDALLDSLTKLTHPEGKDPEDDDPDNPLEQEEKLEDKKQRLLEEGKMKADVKNEIRKYEEDKLQGNSKLLQRTDGKMTRWQGKG